MERLHGSLEPILTISGSLSGQGTLNGVISMPSVIPEYSGEYTITPSDTEQEIPVGGLLAKQNFIINPIPNNYGLITWNGATLTVS